MSDSVQVITQTNGTTTVVKICYHHPDSSSEEEEIQLNNQGGKWALGSKRLLDEAHFDLSDLAEARFHTDGMALKLKPNGNLDISGEYGGDLLVVHPGVITITKGQSFKVAQNFFVNKADLFENAGLLEVQKNWLCLNSCIRNSGKIEVKQGWQVLSLKTFDNMASGVFTMLRVDIESPSTTINNNGKMNCILDFNGQTCVFQNQAGEVHVGGKCILKSLVNKSETEPTMSGYTESEKALVDQRGNKIQTGDGRCFLLTWNGELRFDPKDSCTPGNWRWGFRDSAIGCRKITTNVQKFTRREGKRSLFNVGGHLQLKQPSQVVGSTIIASTFEGNLSLKGYATYKQTVTHVLKNVRTAYFKGNFFGGGGRTVYWDSFVHEGTKTALNELITARLEVLGTATGKIETFVNGKPDSTQPGVVKTTETALSQLKAELQTITNDADIFPMLADPEGYETELRELKANPNFASMVRLQELRRVRSEVPSTVPSVCASPELKE